MVTNAQEMITGIESSTESTDGFVVTTDTETVVGMVLRSTSTALYRNAKDRLHHERLTVQSACAAQSRTPGHEIQKDHDSHDAHLTIAELTSNCSCVESIGCSHGSRVIKLCIRRRYCRPDCR